MRLKLFGFFFLLSFFTANAQYTNVINSNKPGFSESPYSVGTGVYQLESSIFFRQISIEPTFSIPQSKGVDLFFRTGFLSEKLEINSQIRYENNKVAFKNIFVSQYNTSGLSKFSFGAKYLLFEQEYEDKSKEIRSWKRRFAFDKKRLIPSVAVYAGVNFDFVNDIHQTGKIATPKVGILLQNNLSSYFNIISNIFYDKIGSNSSELSYIITATNNFTDRWSWFLENQGVYKKYQNQQNYAGGFAHLFSPNLQINTSLRYLMEGNASGLYTSVGVSYRLNRHQDKVIYLDDNGNEIKPIKKNSYKSTKKGFFGRLLDKGIGFFSKKKRISKVKKQQRPKRVRKKMIPKKRKKKTKKSNNS